MTACLIANDARMQAVAHFLHQGPVALHILTNGQPWADVQQALSGADALVLPIPTRPGKPVLDGLEADALIALTRPGTRIIGAFPAPIQAGGRPVCNLLEDAPFKRQNAVPTAEGAIAHALLKGGKTLSGSRVLITGWGEVAKALAQRIAPFGAHITIAARNPQARMEAAALGYAALHLPVTQPGEWHYLFNTVPAPVLDGGVLSALRPGATLVELASAPYGFDAAGAARLGLTVLTLPGLSGALFPQDAARLTARALAPLLKGETS
nr:NAD(P)-dependent oxidoreductase [bacterium]